MKNIHYVPASDMVKEKLAGLLDINYNLFVSGAQGSGKSYLIDEIIAQMKRPLAVDHQTYTPECADDVLALIEKYEDRQPGASMDRSKQTRVTITEANASSEYDMGILLTKAQKTFADENGRISNDHKRHATHLFTLMVYIDTHETNTDIFHYIKNIKMVNYSANIVIFGQCIYDLEIYRTTMYN